ncbi:MAG: deoxyribodipyrimidine photo-lyase [Polyangiaceae bacterium]|nr:deoxyribodipyrimidine photo-lyase [Polyangiaceae bacterium]
MRTLVWFRGKDVRVWDHAPLADAAKAGEVVPVFVLDPYFFAPERAQRCPHRIQFLLESIAALEESLEALGSRLLLVEGRSVDVIPQIAERMHADRVVAYRWVEPFARERDRRISRALGEGFQLYEGETLIPPGTLRTGAGKPFSVFTPFAKAARRAVPSSAPKRHPKSLPPVPRNLGIETTKLPSLSHLGITHNPRVLHGGEPAARDRLERFLKKGLANYASARDQLEPQGTSRLSADLKFGTLSIRAVWHAVASSDAPAADVDKLESELLWREFAYHVLWERPSVLEHPFREDFEGFPWRDDDDAFAAWWEGKTGYPVVDAAARQLLAEGFVPNRARMIAASFLTKHLLVSFRRGEAHYLKFLTDGDWANNDMGWQWSAGCGCDAQPYFRVFNPMTQGERFDPEGRYVRRFVPELAEMPARFIHRPWEAPPEVLAAAGVRLGKSYPRPIVDHAEARARFLAVAKSHLSC